MREIGGRFVREAWRSGGMNKRFNTWAACVLERLPRVAPMEEGDPSNSERVKKIYPDRLVQSGKKRDAEQDLETWKEASRKAWKSALEAKQDDVERRPEARLVLLLQEKGKDEWKLPLATHQTGETIRATAERALEEALGDAAETYFVGNGPFAHVPLKRNETEHLWKGMDEARRDPNQTEEQEDDEVRIFLHKAQLIDRGPAVKNTWASRGKVAWVALDELNQYVKHPRLADMIYKGLV
mmetsp:Transcript_7045/g.24999  ORF Transcript_7045/g.24999 Transcript_7045/m.24999 type:complete len:240 (+) Transcript_7045:145-864(+)